MPSETARKLRRNPTQAEQQLWSRLRGHQLDGYKFRRQVPLGPYVADFACLSERLVLEVDGGQHASRADEDTARTAWLEKNGFQVLRFWNNEVLGNIEGVLETIRLSLLDPARTPPPRPSPARGEGDGLSPSCATAEGRDLRSSAATPGTEPVASTRVFPPHLWGRAGWGVR